MPLIDARNISKTYAGDGTRTDALCDVSLQIDEGDFVSVMGPSGSGKSTLLHILGLLDRPTEGNYILAGKDTRTLSDEELAHLRNTTLGFIFQAFHLLSRTTVLENVLLPLMYSSVPRTEHRQRALDALERVHLTHRLQHVPSQLSGGEKQRVAIARALVNRPQIILADEPTGNLDSKTSEDVMQMIDELHRNGHTIIVITHENSTAAYAQRIIEFRDGRILADRKASGAHGHFTK